MYYVFANKHSYLASPNYCFERCETEEEAQIFAREFVEAYFHVRIIKGEEIPIEKEKEQAR